MPKVRWVVSYGFCSKFRPLFSSAKIWKSVKKLKISQSYRQFKGGNFFETQCVLAFAYHFLHSCNVRMLCSPSRWLTALVSWSLFCCMETTFSTDFDPIFVTLAPTSSILFLSNYFTHIPTLSSLVPFYTHLISVLLVIINGSHLEPLLMD